MAARYEHGDERCALTNRQERVSLNPLLATDMNFDRVYTWLNRKLVEFRVLAVRDASLRTPEIKFTAAYTRGD
jgi:hypothetical protein